eukprot:551338_1
MSKPDLVQAFIKIISFYGFKISKELVNEIISKGKIKDHIKKIKPVIGIHFHEHCCVKKGQIIKHCTPNYSHKKYGWSHSCAALTKFHSKSVYLSDQFTSTSCGNGKLQSTDHAKSNICGIFINFQSRTFEQFVVEQYNKCFQDEKLKPLSVKEPENTMKITEHICSSKKSLSKEERNSFVKSIIKNYDITKTKLLLKMQEEFWFICCTDNKINNQKNLYLFCMSNLCFNLRFLSIYDEINSEKVVRAKKLKQKELCYLWKFRNKYCSSLYYHCVEKDIDSFDQAKFINITQEEQSILFSDKQISDLERNQVKQYISKQDWIQSAPTKYGFFIDYQEKNIYGLCKNNANIYILIMSSLLTMVEFILNISLNKATNSYLLCHIEKTKDCIQREFKLINCHIKGGTKRLIEENIENIENNENTNYSSHPRKKQKIYNVKNKKQYHLEPNALKVVQQNILNMPDTCQKSYNRVVVNSCVPLCKIKQMRNNMMKSNKYKDKFKHKRNNNQESRNNSECLVPKHNKLYSYTKKRVHSLEWNF